MALSGNVNDREHYKFFDDGNISDHIIKAFQIDRIVPRRIDRLSSVLSYYGIALEANALESEAKWLIWVESTIGNITTVKLASDEEKFDKVWDNRYSYFTENPFNNPFSVNFLNSNDYVNIGDVTELNFSGSDPFTIASWSKNSVSTERDILTKQGAGTASGWRYYLQSNSIGFIMYGGTGAADRIEIRSSNLSINNGLWHFCTLTYDGSGDASGVRFYHDAELDPVVGYTTVANGLVGTVTNTTPAQISGRNGTTNNFQGNLNNISVWDKVLTVSEISEIYGTGAPNDLSSHSAVANLVGWWVCFDEADVNIFPNFTDRSASGNDGTGINMSLSQINIDVPA